MLVLLEITNNVICLFENRPKPYTILHRVPKNYSFTEVRYDFF